MIYTSIAQNMLGKPIIYHFSWGPVKKTTDRSGITLIRCTIPFISNASCLIHWSLFSRARSQLAKVFLRLLDMDADSEVELFTSR